jgi:hypothetical protein
VTEVILTPDQSRQVVGATDGVVFCDPMGEVLLRIPPACSAEDRAIMAEAKRRLASDEPRIPSSEVLEMLRQRESR